jgi:membrane fusion protein (multidrug efflux system)
LLILLQKDLVTMTRKKTIKLVAWIAIVAIGAIGLGTYWHHETIYPSTDDAYVQANIIHVASQVTGPVTKVYVENNQEVLQGEKLVEIDHSPFEIEVQKAQATLTQAKQTMLANVQAVAAAEALLAERQSQLDVTLKNARRTLTLAAKGDVSKAAADQASSDVSVAKSALKDAQSSLAQAQALLGDSDDRNAGIREAASALAQANLDLAHTTLVAPNNGKLVNFDLRTGTMVNANQPLFDLVDEQSWWVDANYKETQLAHIHPGQTATVVLDIYPDHPFKGVVKSISAGSGSAFSILPPENATGNWVKVTQRFSVRVLILDQDPHHPLMVGASATVTIDTSDN